MVRYTKRLIIFVFVISLLIKNYIFTKLTFYINQLLLLNQLHQKFLLDTTESLNP
jgi:hypothetical protein